MTREETERRRQKAWRTRYMRGWDDAISGIKSYPYTREDYRDVYERGFRDAEAGKPLPVWYEEWRFPTSLPISATK